MHLINRHGELERLRTLLDQGLSVVLAGPQGSGKTALLGSLERSLGVDQVVHVPYNRAESSIRFSGLDITMSTLRSLAPGDFVRDVILTGEDDAEVPERFVTLIRSLPVTLPTLLVFDDADAMDADSQDVLGHVLRRFTGGLLRMVVSVRSIDSRSPFSGAPTVVLERFDHSASVALAHQLVPDQLAAESAELVARAGQGNPLAIQDLLENMTPRQRRGETALQRPLRTGAPVKSLLDDEFGTLDEGTREILKVLSLAPLTSYGPLRIRFPELWERLDDLEAAGVIERAGGYLYFANELLRSAIYQEMDAGTRAEMHRRMSEQCAAASPRLMRWHNSFWIADDNQSAELFADACQILREGRADAGIEFCERALQLCADPSEHAHALLDVAAQLHVLGDFVFADRCIRLAGGSKDAAARIRARTLSILTEFCRTQSLPSGFHRPWSRMEASQEPTEVAKLQLTLALCHAWKRDLTESQELLDSAAALQVDFDDESRNLSESVLILLDSSRGRSETTLAAFEKFVDGEFSETVPGVILAEGLIRTEHYNRARAVLEHIDENSPRATIWKAWISTLRAENEIRSGQIGRALELADEARSRHSQCRSIREDRFLLLECWRLLAQGRASDAEAVESQLVDYAARANNRRVIADLNALQGAYLLSVDLPAEALRHLQRCEELSAGISNPNVQRHEPDLIEALIRVGRRENAALALQRFEKRLDHCPSRWGELAADRCEALLAMAERSLEKFQRALRNCGLSDSLYDRARLIECFGRRLDELGYHAQAAEQMKMAADHFDEAGSPRAASRTARRSVEPKVTPDDQILAQLTEEEQSVVELVRMGLKNRDIAHRIFVSLRTVELRLTSVYRKLGVGSRTELVARLSHQPTPA